MIQALENSLAPLREMPLWGAGRAADMLWLQFGARVGAPMARDPNREVGEYAVHVMCPWRLSGSSGVITGQNDMYVPADPDVDESDFRWDKAGSSIVDHQLRRWIQAHEQAPLRVVDISVDRCAGFILRFRHGIAFEIFPDAFSMPHDTREHWRIFEPGRETPHFVVNNHGWG